MPREGCRCWGGLIWLACVGAVTGCQAAKLDLEDLACGPYGECAAGYRCNTATHLCQPGAPSGGSVTPPEANPPTSVPTDPGAADPPGIEDNGEPGIEEPEEAGSCGDGVLSANEACDDGNTVGVDGCGADCATVEPGWYCRIPGQACASECGDELVAEGAEVCDDGTGNSDEYAAEPHCDTACLGFAPYCGDGVTQQEEECDGGQGCVRCMTEVACTPGWSDSFDDNQIDRSNWTPWSADNVSEAIREEDMELLVTKDCAQRSYSGVRLRPRLDLIEHAVWLKATPERSTDAQWYTAVQLEVTPGVWQESLFVVVTSEANQLQVGYHSLTGGGEATSQILASPPYNEEAHRFWRIEERAGRVRWLTSATGVDWELLADAETPFDVSDLSLNFLLGALECPADGVPIEGKASIDDFNVPQPDAALSCP